MEDEWYYNPHKQPRSNLMRWYRTLAPACAAGVSFPAAGCSPPPVPPPVAVASVDLFRAVYREHGPPMAATVVGAAAPGGGPAVLNGLGAAAAWRAVIAGAYPELGDGPPPFAASVQRGPK